MTMMTQLIHLHEHCDESKCVSKPFSHDGSFTCYGTRDVSRPMMCADGFLPVVLEQEEDVVPPIPVEYFDSILREESLEYFTCCPPSSLQGEQPQEEEFQDQDEEDGADSTPTAISETVVVDLAGSVARQCSDPITVMNSANVSDLCVDEDIRKYPRKMKDTLVNFRMECSSYICCDSPLPETSMETLDTLLPPDVTSNVTFLETTECVPYKNEFYDAPNAQNQIGLLRPITCDFTQGDFPVPRPLHTPHGTSNRLDLQLELEEVMASGQYQCCRTGASLPPFVQDQGFQITVYPVVTLWSIAVLCSVLVAIGLLVPLLIQLKNGTYQKATMLLNRGSRVSGGEPRYSTYNLYVVYLALLDVLVAVVELALYGSYLDQQFHRGFYGSLAIPWMSYGLPPELLVSIFYAASNMWINAIICYEVLILLKSSRKAKRINQPGLTRVNLQVAAVVFWSGIYSMGVYFLFEASDKALEKCLFDRARNYKTTLLVLSAVVALPVVYVVYASVSIWRRGYLPSLAGASHREKAMRELAFFFFRIVAVFMVVWLPMALLFVFGYLLNHNYGVGVVCFCLMALQPILTFGMILTKSDARRYIWNLVTGKYLRSGCQGEKHLPKIGTSKTWDVPKHTSATEDPSTRKYYSSHFLEESTSSVAPFGGCSSSDLHPAIDEEECAAAVVDVKPNNSDMDVDLEPTSKLSSESVSSEDCEELANATGGEDLFDYSEIFGDGEESQQLSSVFLDEGRNPNKDPEANHSKA